MNRLHRRQFIQRAGLAGISVLGLWGGLSRVMADPDPAPGSAPAPTGNTEAEIHSFKFGGVDAYVILEGVINMPGVQPAFAPEAKPEELEAVMQRNFESSHRLAMSLNVLVLKLKSGVVIFDSGAGQLFGAAAGRLLQGLAKIGVSPADVKTIYVTHAHTDHIGGLLDGDRLVFSSATIVASKTEVDFWLSDSPDLSGLKLDEASRKPMIEKMKQILTTVKPKLELHAPGALNPEVEMVAAPGHTPGHSMYRVTVGGETLLVIGDAVHVWSCQFDRPDWSMIFDVKPDVAIATRKKLFAKAADERTVIQAYHLPFPGLGNVRKNGNGFEWVPKSWV